MRSCGVSQKLRFPIAFLPRRPCPLCSLSPFFTLSLNTPSSPPRITKPSTPASPARSPPTSSLAFAPAHAEHQGTNPNLVDHGVTAVFVVAAMHVPDPFLLFDGHHLTSLVLFIPFVLLSLIPLHTQAVLDGRYDEKYPEGNAERRLDLVVHRSRGRRMETLA